MTANPFRAARQARAGQTGERFVGYAGFVTRTMAMVIDLAIIFVLWVVGGMTLEFFRRTSGIDELLRLLFGALDWRNPGQGLARNLLVSLLTLQFFSFLYFTFFIRIGGATIGKYLLGLRVLRTNGRPLRTGRAALRALAYTLSSLPLYFGFLNILIDDRRRGWHDLITGTVVVYYWRDYPETLAVQEPVEP